MYESGDSNWTLAFQKSNISSQSLVAGIRGQYDFVTLWGTISPTARVEYRRMLNGNVTQLMSYSSDPTTNYSFVATGNNPDIVMGNIGIKISNKQGVSGSMEYIIGGSTNNLQSQGLRALIQLPF
jgi:uncharacterized protein with beta-barrel porin domain